MWRVRDRATFDALRRSRRRGRSGPISVTWAPPTGADAEPPKVALAVGRKFANAVVRNRMRRRLREAARVLSGQGELPAGAYLIGAAAEARPLSFTEVCDHLAQAVAEVTKKVDAP